MWMLASYHASQNWNTERKDVPYVMRSIEVFIICLDTFAAAPGFKGRVAPKWSRSLTHPADPYRDCGCSNRQPLCLRSPSPKMLCANPVGTAGSGGHNGANGVSNPH